MLYTVLLRLSHWFESMRPPTLPIYHSSTEEPSSSVVPYLVYKELDETNERTEKNETNERKRASSDIRNIRAVVCDSDMVKDNGKSTDGFANDV